MMAVLTLMARAGRAMVSLGVRRGSVAYLPVSVYLLSEGMNGVLQKQGHKKKRPNRRDSDRKAADAC